MTNNNAFTDGERDSSGEEEHQGIDDGKRNHKRRLQTPAEKRNVQIDMDGKPMFAPVVRAVVGVGIVAVHESRQVAQQGNVVSHFGTRFVLGKEKPS